MSYCLFHLHAGSIRTWATAKLQTTAFSVFASAWWEENMNLSEDSKLGDLLYVKVTIYFRDYELMHQIMIKRIFYSSYSYAQSHFHSLLLPLMFECLRAPQNRFTHWSGWNLPHDKPSWPSHTIAILCKQTVLFQYAVFRWGAFFFLLLWEIRKMSSSTPSNNSKDSEKNNPGCVPISRSKSKVNGVCSWLRPILYTGFIGIRLVVFM